MCSDKTMKISTDAASSWSVSIYKNDIYEYLKTLEQQRLPYQRRSPQLHYRCGLVIYLKELIDKVSFCRVTLHLAVFLLDFFMDSHSVKPEKLTLIAFTCLVLAGKFEEHERKVPSICDMNEYLNSDYIQKDIIYLEHKILKYFNWKLNMPTAVHFAEYFLNFAIVPNDLLCKSCARFNHYNVMKHCLDSFVDRSLEDDLLISYPPSFIAASCLLAVRITMNLSPVWPDQLEEVTTYSESDLKICSARILGCREECPKKRKRKLELSPDQGYETEKGCSVTPKTKKE